MESLLPSVTVRAGHRTHRFESDPHDLPYTFNYEDRQKDLSAFLQETWTTGMVALKDGKIAFEEYYWGNTETSRVILWTASQAIVSVLVGIAIESRAIPEVDGFSCDRDPLVSCNRLIRGREGSDHKARVQILRERRPLRRNPKARGSSA